MVVSIRPIVLGNMPPDGEEDSFEKVAFMGQTPVKVLGEVEVGDFLIPSGMDNGLAIAVNPERISINQLRQVIGVSWEKSDTSFGLVNAAVGLRTADIAAVMERQHFSLTTAEEEIQELTRENRALANQQAALSKQIEVLQTQLAVSEARSLQALRMVESVAAQLKDSQSGLADSR